MATNLPQHDDTIVPVRPGLRASQQPPAAPAAPRRSVVGRIAGIAGGTVLVAAVAGAFVWLPRYIEGTHEREPTAAAAPAAPATPAKPVLSPEEEARLRAEAEQRLADLLEQENRLNAQGVAAWGGDNWQQYETLLRTGADALLGGDPQRAVADYTQANDLGEALLARGRQTVDGALAAGAAAFAAGNSALAIQQYDLVLGIDPGNAPATAGRERASRLPEVLAAMQRADDARARGDSTAALAAYREALALDPGWEPARRASAEVTAGVASAAFERAMSQAFAALAAEDFTAAGERFQAALALRPGSKEAADGLAQAEQGVQLDKIALTEARALAFERRELWDQAIAQYQGVLETDGDLVFAQTGLERARARAGLDAKLNNLIANPTLLFGDTVLADARKLLAEAGAVPEAGPRLTSQVRDLGRLVDLATTPIAVRIESDQLTDVTLYRVGALGQFAAKSVELRPGTYTAIGSRDGYRDVRRTFTVVPGRDLPSISVICNEPI